MAIITALRKMLFISSVASLDGRDTIRRLTSEESTHFH
jgi:hypothetical protein